MKESLSDVNPLFHICKRGLLLLVGVMACSGGILQAQTANPSMDAQHRSSNPAGWDHLKYAIYFTYSEIERLLVDSTSFKDVVEYFAPVRAEKVYLEYSGTENANVADLKKVAEAFRSRGFKVSGALVPNVPGGPACYNNPEHLAIIERRSKALAEVFDEFIIDDWLFTTCTCEKCVAGRGDQSWADYRTKLLLEKSKRYIIDAAKKVRPGIRVIIKYPNWYEGHRENGYDVLNETHQFDAMAVGIETRTRAIHDQHIPIYSGYVFQRWWSSVDPKKWVGSWLDNYTMTGQGNDYVAQVWQAVLAQTPEIILWSGGNLYRTGPFSNVYPKFREMLPDFDRVAGVLNGSPRGVPMYLPYGSEGEYNIFGYLGMAGIPIDPVGQFPSGSQNAIFTEHSLRDPKLAEKLIDRLTQGHDVFMTWQFWLKLQDSEFKNTLNLTDIGGTSVTSSEFRTRMGWNDQVVKSDRAFTFPRISTTTWPYARDVAVVRDDYDFGVLLDVKYLNGSIYVLNMPENFYDLLSMPAQALNMIRRPFAKELGVALSGPGSVGMYLYGSGQYVLYNMSDEIAPVSLRFDREVPAAGWTELAHGEQVSVSSENSRERPWGGSSRVGEPPVTNVSVTLQPFELVILQAP